MNNFALGKYIPLDSLIHKLDPRAKIAAMLLMMVAIFIPAGYIGYVIIGLLLMVLVHIAGLNLNFLWRSMKPMLFMMSFLLVINILVMKDGYVLLQISNFKIYSSAITQTVYIVVRLMLMIMITTLLTATTKPLDLTLGIEDLLSPLKVIKVPAHEIAMIISLALRFIPTLIEEMQRIMKAQASRGVDLEEGKLFEKVIAISSLLIPLFVSAMQRADDLANAMEARAYVPGRTRTRYKQLKMTGKDYAAILLSVALLMCMVAIWVFL